MRRTRFPRRATSPSGGARAGAVRAVPVAAGAAAAPRRLGRGLAAAARRRGGGRGRLLARRARGGRGRVDADDGDAAVGGDAGVEVVVGARRRRGVVAGVAGVRGRPLPLAPGLGAPERLEQGRVRRRRDRLDRVVAEHAAPLPDEGLDGRAVAAARAQAGEGGERGREPRLEGAAARLVAAERRRRHPQELERGGLDLRRRVAEEQHAGLEQGRQVARAPGQT